MEKSLFCNKCGTELIQKINITEGNLPFNYCPTCDEFRFEKFSTACSMIVFNKKQDKILLVKQYGNDYYILVAGYVMQGENAEVTALRELKEELGVDATIISFNETSFYEKNNTLMINFAVSIEDQTIKPNSEIDSYAWFSLSESRNKVKDNSLAEKFLLDYLNKI